MKTAELPSDLINQAITNTDNAELALMLWEAMKQATYLEMKHKYGKP